MGKLKTPIVRPLRKKGGTFFTFASAIEDIGLNITERNNKVKLSHYATLNIPDCNEKPNENDNNIDASVNRFNIFSVPGAMGNRYVFNDGEENTGGYMISQDINSAVAQSFMSYALNMETAVINNSKYDYSTSLTVSERIFWKWLKECGAIRWHKVDGKLYEGDATPNESYSRVVQSIGKIDGVSQRSSDYGMYNEVYVNIPSSFGTTEPIIFREVEDNNYSYNKQYISDTERLIGYSTDNEYLYSDQIYNIGFYDYSLAAENIKSNYKTDDNDGIWSEKYATDLSGSVFGMYLTDSKVIDGENENNKILINISKQLDNNVSNPVNYGFLRSKYDCISIDMLLNSEDYIDKSYDDLAMSDNSERYFFNAILVYYSIYDNNDKVLATNLYGVYFIDSCENLENSGNNNYTFKFQIPRLEKVKSTADGFGTSYSFRLNMRTKSIYDDTSAEINDNSSSENSIVSDFNNVVANLNKSIELLGKHTKHTHVLTEKYNDVNTQIEKLKDDLVSVTENVNNLLNNQIIDINSESIKTNKLSVNNFDINNDNIVEFKLNNNSIIDFDDDIINLNNTVNINKPLLYSADLQSEVEEVEELDNIFNNIRIVPKSSQNDNIFDLLDIEILRDSDMGRNLGLNNGKIDLITIIAYILQYIKNKK